MCSNLVFFQVEQGRWDKVDRGVVRVRGGGEANLKPVSREAHPDTLWADKEIGNKVPLLIFLAVSMSVTHFLLYIFYNRKPVAVHNVNCSFKSLNQKFSLSFRLLFPPFFSFYLFFHLLSVSLPIFFSPTITVYIFMYGYKYLVA